MTLIQMKLRCRHSTEARVGRRQSRTHTDPSRVIEPCEGNMRSEGTLLAFKSQRSHCLVHLRCQMPEFRTRFDAYPQNARRPRIRKDTYTLHCKRETGWFHATQSALDCSTPLIRNIPEEFYCDMQSFRAYPASARDVCSDLLNKTDNFLPDVWSNFNRYEEPHFKSAFCE